MSDHFSDRVNSVEMHESRYPEQIANGDRTYLTPNSLHNR